MKYTNFNRILRNQTAYIKTATAFNLSNSIFYNRKSLKHKHLTNIIFLTRKFIAKKRKFNYFLLYLQQIY